jgi:drug/metabolite transporter (DMT)-like permease
VKVLRQYSKVMAAIAGSMFFLPSPVLACAACYGRSDSPLASAMNWGIFTLLGVVITVLVSIAGFFFYIIRRETAHATTPSAGQNLSEAKI